MKEKVLFFSLILVWSFTWAQTVPKNLPSPVSQNPPIGIPLSKAKVSKIIKPKPASLVLLDARPFFDYSVQHYDKSQPIRWKDYAQIEIPFQNCLDPDLRLLVRKLRVLGVHPKVEVVVLTSNKSVELKEDSDSLRIVWMLNHLGIKKVSMIEYEKLDSHDPKIISQIGPIKKVSGIEFSAVEAPYWDADVPEGKKNCWAKDIK